MNKCKLEDCNIKSKALGLCRKHYRRFKTHGSTDKPLPTPTRITFKGSVATLHLQKGIKCLIDKDDIKIARMYRTWCWSSSNGVISQWFSSDGVHHHIKIHRLIMDCPKGLVVDHMNGNRLDNRKSNLRILKHWENIINQKSRPLRNIEKSGEHGYSVRMWKNKKRYYFGYYSTLKEAIKARDKYAKELHGEFRLR